MADVLGFEKIQHAQAIDWIFSGSAVINVSSEGNLRQIEAPGEETFIAHAAVARLIVRPARSVVNPLPGQNVGKRTQHHTARLDRPHFIEVTDRGAELQLHPFSVGEGGIDHIWPVEATWPEARITGGPVGNGICLRAWQRPGCNCNGCSLNPYASQL